MSTGTIIAIGLVQICTGWENSIHFTYHPEKINVWLGIVEGQFVGPLFIYGNINADEYRWMLEHLIIPGVQLASNYFRQIWVQQDGAPPHYGRYVRTYLNDIFPNRWMGRRGAIEWPARSPDLSPLGYFVWGHIKDNVYKPKPHDINDLREKIGEVLQRISQESILLSVASIYIRLAHC